MRILLLLLLCVFTHGQNITVSEECACGISEICVCVDDVCACREKCTSGDSQKVFDNRTNMFKVCPLRYYCNICCEDICGPCCSKYKDYGQIPAISTIALVNLLIIVFILILAVTWCGLAR